eukprot:1159786-Pelagomonas_calceolata.AAC.1
MHAPFYVLLHLMRERLLPQKSICNEPAKGADEWGCKYFGCDGAPEGPNLGVLPQEISLPGLAPPKNVYAVMFYDYKDTALQ